jgi:hypothetical protein
MLERPADLRAAGGLLALVLVLFFPALDPDRIFFERDVANYWYPQVECFVRTIAEGSWPVWNPHFTFGLPMWEDPAYQIAYPPTWLNLILLPHTYYKLFAIGHAWLAALGVYAFLRAAGARPPPGSAGCSSASRSCSSTRARAPRSDSASSRPPSVSRARPTSRR